MRPNPHARLVGRDTEPAPPSPPLIEYCSQHGQIEPCYVCERNAQDRAIHDLLRSRWAEISPEFSLSTPKCVHGHMYADDYCDVCRLGPVDPTYNPREFEETINKAIKKAKDALMQSTNGVFFSVGALTEGQKNWQDLRQLVDLEVWLGKKKYGTEWNDALCYTIARNVAGAYLGERIKEQTVLVEDEEGHPVLDEFGVELGLNGAELKHKMSDESLTAEERGAAREQLQRYQKRVPRFMRFDVKLTDAGDDESDMSEAELEIAKREREGRGDGLDWEVMKDRLPELRELVATWHGVQRKVGEALLEGALTVRDIPGVPKSTAHRARKTVLEAFRKQLNTQGL